MLYEVITLTTLAAYLIGSVSFAVIVSRVFSLPDPRSYGSGNPGATNVLRSGRKSAAALTLLEGRWLVPDDENAIVVNVITSYSIHYTKLYDECGL